jgi:hypothetical protein
MLSLDLTPRDLTCCDVVENLGLHAMRSMNCVIANGGLSGPISRQVTGRMGELLRETERMSAQK